MIVSLRGASGAGKTHLVREIMSRCLRKSPMFSLGRRHPIGYKLGLPFAARESFLLGHYEATTPNGGVDTLKTLEDAYRLIDTWHGPECHVLYEGKNMSDGYQRISVYPPDNVRVILLSTPLDECVDSVRKRGHMIRYDSIQKVHAKCLRDAGELRNRGYNVQSLDRTSALAYALEVLQG